MSKAKPNNIEEVMEYISANEFAVDADEWFDHMEMVGYVYGRNKLPVRDWKASVRTWNRFAKQRNKEKSDGGFKL